MSKEFKIGLLALVSSVLLFAGFNFLKGTDFFSRTNTYYVIYDSVDGLTVSNPIQVNGLNVGRVAKIEILQDQGNKLILTLEIRNDLKLGEQSLAILTDNGLLGGKMIDLEIGLIKKVLQHKDTLKARKAEGLLAGLSQKADPLVVKADSIMTSVNTVVQALAQSKGDITDMLKNFNDISGSLKNTLAQEDINQMLRNMRQLSASLLVLEKQFHPIASKMDSLTTKFNRLEIEKATKELNASMANLNQILKKVNEGEGTLGALANDDSLYTNFIKVSENADKLFIDLRENPKRYLNISVFGKKDKETKPE
jgi:phospholipid/cholesterol/gamma-HCH transport system substrate-binding protein